MVSSEILNIKGHGGRTLNNRFYQHSAETKKVALVFPGQAYTSSMPLLHYTVQAILASGISVLTVDYDYSNNEEYMKQEIRERADWLVADVEAALEFITKKKKQEVVCLTGKSLGTIAVGHLLEKYENLRAVKTVWLTPLIKNPELMEQMLNYMKDSVLVIGTKDSHYDSDIIDRLNMSTQLSGIVIEGANHSLEIEGDTVKSLRVLMQIVTILQQFLM